MTTVWGQILPDDGSHGARDAALYVFAAGAGIFAGWVDIKVGDLLFTALLVLAPCMVLGVLRPSRPWRWVAIVAVFVPVAELLGFLVLAEKPYRAQIYESLLAFLPGIAGAYGGAMMRRAIGNIFSEK
jgi:ABC-type multidrug transport system permease subunit